MRQDQWLVTITVDGVPYGTFDKADGGDLTASDTKYRPGGMVPEKSLGGPTTIDNMTLTRLCERERDWALMKQLMTRAGKARAVVNQQPLDPNGVAWGDPMVRTGSLTKVSPPKPDSSGTGASTWDIEISCDGTVG